MITNMIMAGAFYQSVEFYVVAAVVAAAVLGACVRPARRDAVVTHLLAGELSDDSPAAEPGIELECRDDRTVRLTRRGVDCIGLGGAVSLAVSVNGFDIVIKERLVPGDSGQDQTVKADFYLDFIAPERYHIRYESDDTGYFTAFTLTNMPGVKISRELRQ